MKGDVREASERREEQGSVSSVQCHIPSTDLLLHLLPSWTTSAGRDIPVPVHNAQPLLRLLGPLRPAKFASSEPVATRILLWPQLSRVFREGELKP